ncbi:thioredoxin-like protein [Mycena maculata]|uniref:glutathione transferase n=1 Tax=Mycena maculata TaxID=230809 RepID=A0AAD7IP26_9AGAR|nr:thioredoxin-like protein [Mycena maculata]
MAILRLVGFARSTSTRRVVTVLHELKIPFELIEVDFYNGEHKGPDFLKHQPFGQTPYIDDDGFILYDSRAICRYLAAKHPESGLIPTDLKSNALFEQAAAVEVTHFYPSASLAGFQLYQRSFGDPYDQAVLAEQLEILDKKLDAYDVILEKRYMAGDTFTLVDLFYLPYAPLVTLDESDIMTKRPNVARWYKELVARPSWLATASLEKIKTTTAY